MSTALSFVLIHPGGEDDIRHSCAALAEVLQAGDDLVLIDAGPDTGAPRSLRQFTREDGWPHGITPSLITLAEAPTAPQLPGLIKTHCAQPYALWLESSDIVQPKGIAQLRQGLGRAPDLIIANHGWHLGHALAALECADVARWPETLSADVQIGGALMPDPRRLIGPAAGLVYDTALAQAKTVHLVPEPVMLRPLPARMDEGAVDRIADSVMAAPRAQRPAALQRALGQLEDALDLLHPAQVPSVLAQLNALHTALPRGLRKQAGAQMPLMGALARGGTDAALPYLTLHIAAQDRARTEAMGKALKILRRDVDTALPGPAYLIDLYARTRRG